MTDVNRRAIALARRNVRRNGSRTRRCGPGSLFATVGPERYDLIATNPPFHAGRELSSARSTEAPEHLTDDGRLLVVGKGSQGIRFYQGGSPSTGPEEVEVLARGGGYRVVEARRRPPSVQA